MDRKNIHAQLLSMRHQIAALAAQVEALLMQCESTENKCTHPNKIDMSTFQGEEWKCPDCGYHYKEGES